MVDLAGRQHGVVSRRQLLDLGLKRGWIRVRIQRGQLHRMHAGVYALGRPDLPLEGRWLAGVLAGGDAAVLSHGSAAELWDIRRRRRASTVEIASPRSTRSTNGLRRHFVQRRLSEVTTRKGIPVTTLPRTIIDLAAILRVEALEAAVREAQYAHSLDPESLRRLLYEYRGCRGVARLRLCLDNLGIGPKGRTRSRLEDRFASLLARSEIPQPQLNALVDVGGELIEADCLWARERVIIELDGGAHRTDSAFESDRARDRRLQALGWKVGRVTWSQLDEPEAVLADLRRMLEGS
ncbi:MAG TPA: DUF559 domain-containing protein [Solirubrobacterales bacterium]